MKRYRWAHCVVLDLSAMTAARFTRFLPGEPASSDDKNCVSMSNVSQWAWQTRPCTDKMLFVCHIALYLHFAIILSRGSIRDIVVGGSFLHAPFFEPPPPSLLSHPPFPSFSRNGIWKSAVSSPVGPRRAQMANGFRFRCISIPWEWDFHGISIEMGVVLGN